MSLRNKRILITAGPTWVPIDSVRVISNIATGATGIMLAQQLQRLGAKVTLLLGPVEAGCLDKKIKLVRFKFFDELRSKIIKALRLNRYDVIIHNAAVSDFKPIQVKGKIDSQKARNLRLKPLPKIIQDIRRLASQAKLIMFKLEWGVSDKTLIIRARHTQSKAGADFVVANKINPYRAFIIDKQSKIIAAKSKSELVKKIVKII